MTVDPAWDDFNEPLGEEEEAANVEAALTSGGMESLADFKPTYRRPIPGSQCIATVKNGEHAGERCRRRSIYGHRVCLMHGGGAPAVRKKAEAIIQAARMRLIDDTQEAVTVLEDLLQNAASEAVRLKAATEVLDRSGVRGGVDVDVTVTNSQDPAAVLRERLSTLKARTDAIVIEGEVLDPAEDGVTLTPSADTEQPEE